MTTLFVMIDHVERQRKRPFRCPQRGQLVAAFVVALLILTGCQNSNADEGIDVPGEAILRDVVWLADGYVYYVVAGVSDLPDELWRASVNGAAAEQIAVSPGGRCRRFWSLFHIERDLGISASCENHNEKVVLKMQPSTLQTRVLTAVQQITAAVAHSTNGHYWDDERGCQLVLANDDGRSLLSASLENNGETARLLPAPGDTANVTAEDDPCDDSLAAGRPATSIDGSKLAFIVTLDGGPATLYYGDVGKPARMLVRDIDQPRHIAVSPDGRRVAVVASYRGAREILMVDAESRRSTRLAEDRFGDIAFSPDGLQIVAVRGRSLRVGDELLVIELASPWSPVASALRLQRDGGSLRRAGRLGGRAWSGVCAPQRRHRVGRNRAHDGVVAAVDDEHSLRPPPVPQVGR